MKRLQGLIEAGAAADAGADAGAGHQAFQILRGKRVLGSSAFLQRAETPFVVLSFLVASFPIDRLFATFFECEAFAKTKGGRAGDRGAVGLVQSLVSRDGILHRVHTQLASPLFAEDSPLKHVQGLAAHCSLEAGQGIQTCRGMQLRMSASFRSRFLGTFWEKPMDMLNMLNVEGDRRQDMMNVFLSPDEHNVCSKCEGVFLVRLRCRLIAPPVLSLEEKTAVVMEIFESIAEDPMMVSMHQVEVMHAQAKAAMVKATIRRKKLPVTLASCLSIGRWRTLHLSRMGDKMRPVDSVRKHILKKPEPLPRTKCGHNLFLREENERRNDLHTQNKQKQVRERGEKACAIGTRQMNREVGRLMQPTFLERMRHGGGCQMRSGKCTTSVPSLSPWPSGSLRKLQTATVHILTRLGGSARLLMRVPQRRSSAQCRSCCPSAGHGSGLPTSGAAQLKILMRWQA